MSLLHADPVNLERVTMLDVIFAETTGVCSISSKIGSCNRKGQSYLGEKTKCRNNILTGEQTRVTPQMWDLLLCTPKEQDTIPTLTTWRQLWVYLALLVPSCALDKLSARLVFPKEFARKSNKQNTNHPMVRSAAGLDFTGGHLSAVPFLSLCPQPSPRSSLTLQNSALPEELTPKKLWLWHGTIQKDL